MDEYEIHLDDIVSNIDLDRHYRTRNKKYIYKRAISTDVKKDLDNGWERIGPKNRKMVRLRKTKDVGLDFQDSVWCIFYKMGFSEMNREVVPEI